MKTSSFLMTLSLIASCCFSIGWMFSCWNDPITSVTGSFIRYSGKEDHMALVLWAAGRIVLGVMGTFISIQIITYLRQND